MKKHDPRKLLSESVMLAAEQTTVWIVDWELPDKSWEALCVSPDAAQRLWEEKRNDHVITSWGAATLRGEKVLFQWFVEQIQSSHPAEYDKFVTVVDNVLRERSAPAPQPVVVRTW